jgi:hypothetical protein
MAKQDGIIKIQGTLENLTFFKSTDGYMVRTKGGVSKNRIMNDPAFVRTRENGTEFGHSATSGRLLRTAAGNFVFRAKDSKLSSRLLKVMSAIKNLDSVSDRGSRNVAEGIQTPEGRELLRGFDFNNRALMKSVLYAPITLDTDNGTVEISELNPAQQLRFPKGATHFSMQSAYINLDFGTGISDIRYSTTVNYPIDYASTNVSLEIDGIPTGTGSSIYVLLIEFFQEVNGTQYSLNNGAYNVLHVLEVL